MTALKVEEKFIDKVEVALENLSNIKEYSATKADLKDIGSISSTVRITEWTVAILHSWASLLCKETSVKL